MKTFVILSDTHGNVKNLDALSRLFDECDYIVHLGDGAWDMREIQEKYPEKTYVLQGNCDIRPALKDAEIQAESVKIFACHGHAYSVKSGWEKLAREAKKRGADIALYGHTHQAEIREVDGILCINPGTLSYPLHRGGTYCYLVVHGKKATPVIVGEDSAFV